ncbi:MAG: hypothetical protein GX610_13825 [Rhodococcus sp.]|nr:hypothetical protein [Rhodococcus sp. (in: high G+C Gram-positive bacteria)]
MKDTVRYGLPPAIVFGVGMGVTGYTGIWWAMLFSAVLGGVIFYVLYSMLDRNPAAEESGDVDHAA